MRASQEITAMRRAARLPSGQARSLLAAAVIVVTVPVLASAQSIDAEALYQRSCAACHDGGNDRAPRREALQTMTPARALAAMETGAMITMANNRTAAERRALAEF